MSRFHLTEVFDTIQGEGAQTGQRMVFVRFAGCNLWNGKEEGRSTGRGDCARWCDTDFRPRLTLTALELLERMGELWPQETDHRWVCLTGGEPMLQVTHALIDALHADGWRIALETNGTVDYTDQDGCGTSVLEKIDHVTVSPKVGGDLVIFPHRASVKVVLPGGWSPAELSRVVAHFHGASSFYVQPQAGHPDGLTTCLGIIRHHPRWRLSLQTHKLIGLP